MSKQNLNEILGPQGKGDYSVGDTITFRDQGQEYAGVIIHVEAPGQTATGRHSPLTYHVDCGDGWPRLAYQTDIIVDTETIDEYEHRMRGEAYQNEKERKEAIRDTQGGVFDDDL